jgi:hypothetical protein
MSRLFGPLRQMGFVVRDIDKAMRHWVEVCGIGPWYIAERLPLHGFWYKEQRYDAIHLTIALANSGDVQLELIQQRDDTPSMYRDFLAAAMRGCSTGRAGPRIIMNCSTGRSATAGRSANAARARAARSCISSMRVTPARSSRWPS